MQTGDIYLVYTERLDALGLSYAATGSVASSIYGEPRFTHDMDLLLLLPEAAIDQFWSAFSVHEFYGHPVETLRQESGRAGSGHFYLVHHESGFRADVYVVEDTGLMGWALENTRTAELVPGRTLCIAPPEYVILSKLEFYSEGGGDEHRRDIQTMLEVGGEDLRREIIEAWVPRLGVEAAWKSIRPV